MGMTVLMSLVKTTKIGWFEQPAGMEDGLETDVTPRGLIVFLKISSNLKFPI
jgi:hypothetical protein